jgi:hypothetical protein
MTCQIGKISYWYHGGKNWLSGKLIYLRMSVGKWCFIAEMPVGELNYTDRKYNDMLFYKVPKVHKCSTRRFWW